MRIEMSHMPPALQHHSSFKRLSFRGDDETIVLAPCAGVRFAPVKLESFQLQCVERNEQVRRPLITITAFPQTVINKEIIKDRRAKHAVLPPELIDSGIGAISQQRRLLPIHSG